MFQSPLGGISFIVNLIIVLLGALTNKIRGRDLGHPLITQYHIDKIHSTRTGSIVSRALTYVIPVVLFMGVGTISLSYVMFFYNDEQKITVASAYEYTSEHGSEQYNYISNSIDTGISRHNPLARMIGEENYKKTKRGMLVLQDTITTTAIDNFPIITNILAKR